MEQVNMCVCLLVYHFHCSNYNITLATLLELPKVVLLELSTHLNGFDLLMMASTWYATQTHTHEYHTKDKCLH